MSENIDGVKTCPFCDSPRILYNNHGQYDWLHTVYCGDCNGSMTKYDLKTAIAHWNKRP